MYLWEWKKVTLVEQLLDFYSQQQCLKEDDVITCIILKEKALQPRILSAVKLTRIE